MLVELLSFLVYWNDGEALNLVISALETLSSNNEQEHTPYAYWFQNMETILSGRGKMGSLVGASEDVRKNAAMDGSVNDYAVRPLNYLPS